MTQEEKDLLLKDLYARLPYGVKATLSEYHIDEFPYNGTYCDKVINLGTCEDTINLLNHIEKYGVKPFLRPMSSMTQKEIDEYDAELDKDMDVVMDGALDKDRHITSDGKHNFSKNFVAYFGNDWLNAHHFDYRGLIEKGLALEAPEGMYKAEELK